MKEIQSQLSSWEFIPINNYGIDEDAKEAFAFAILAHRAVIKKNNHISSVTGAQKDLILGAIYYGGL